MWLRKARSFLELQRNQWRDRDSLAELQRVELRRVLQHADETVPYYREMFASLRLRPEQIESVEDLRTLPITTKKDLVARPPEDRLSSAWTREQSVHFETSGSTGEVFDIWMDRPDVDRRLMSLLRTRVGNGYRPGTRIAVVMYSPIHNRRFYRPALAPCFEVPITLPIAAQIELLRKRRPRTLEGYPSRLSEIAETLVRCGMDDIRPKLILTNSETLPDSERELIRRGFGVDPTNVYDSWEFGNIAWQCPQRKGLHLNADLMIVEVVNGDRPAAPGETGEIVVTDFQNRAMPLLRYAMGDIARVCAEPCACGRGLPLITAVTGRTADRVQLADGSYVLLYAELAELMITTTGVRNYQGVQSRPGQLEVRFVTDRALSPADQERIERHLREKIGLDEITFRRLERIERGAQGKLQPFVSEIEPDHPPSAAPPS